MKSITKNTIAILLMVALFFSGSCDKNNYTDIPDVYVNLYLDISSTMYIELSTVGGWVNITGGYKGITVYRYSQYDFIAFERCCTYDVEVDSARVMVDPSGLTLTCPACGSTFLILDGSIVNGPASRPLKQYMTYFNGDDLHIYN